jgi:hypothetical protein
MCRVPVYYYTEEQENSRGDGTVGMCRVPVYYYTEEQENSRGDGTGGMCRVPETISLVLLYKHKWEKC